MSRNATPSSMVGKAAARLFRSYERHCRAADEDALFDFLSALHSMGDKFNALGRPNLDSSQNFVALRALRNLYHHEAELLHATRTILVADVPAIISDLALLCLLPRSTVDRTLERVKKDSDREAIQSVLHWYDRAVNIEPAIFNVMVDVFELLAAKEVDVDGESYTRFRNQYDYETANDYSHYVTGHISVHFGSIQTVLDALMAPVDEASIAS